MALQKLGCSCHVQNPTPAASTTTAATPTTIGQRLRFPLRFGSPAARFAFASAPCASVPVFSSMRPSSVPRLLLHLCFFFISLLNFLCMLASFAEGRNPPLTPADVPSTKARLPIPSPGGVLCQVLELCTLAAAETPIKPPVPELCALSEASAEPTTHFVGFPPGDLHAPAPSSVQRAASSPATRVQNSRTRKGGRSTAHKQTMQRQRVARPIYPIPNRTFCWRRLPPTGPRVRIRNNSLPVPTSGSRRAFQDALSCCGGFTPSAIFRSPR